ncbi:MAG: hypothetical protein ACRCXZ_08560 [Patescibacteria group bacterium]
MTVITRAQALEMIKVANAYKALSAQALLIHTNAKPGTLPSEYQLKLKGEKNHAKNMTKAAQAAYDQEQTEENLADLKTWTKSFEDLSKQIQDDMKLAREQYLLIRKSNWIFVTLYDQIMTNPELSDAQLGHAIGAKKDRILSITIDGQELSCPQGFTTIETDAFDAAVELSKAQSGEFQEIEAFGPELVALMEQSKARFIAYD